MNKKFRKNKYKYIFISYLVSFMIITMCIGTLNIPNVFANENIEQTMINNKGNELLDNQKREGLEDSSKEGTYQKSNESTELKEEDSTLKLITPFANNRSNVKAKPDIKTQVDVSEQNSDGTYDSQLDLKAKNGIQSKKEKVDIVFVYDASASMRRDFDGGGWPYSYERANAAKEIINNMVQEISKKNKEVDARFSLVSFENMATKESGWTNNITGFKSSVNNIHISTHPLLSGTNYQAGLIETKKLVQEVKKDNSRKIVIFISDGKPGLYVENGRDKGKYNPNESQARYALEKAANELATIGNLDALYTVCVGAEEKAQQALSYLSSYAQNGVKIKNYNGTTKGAAEKAFDDIQEQIIDFGVSHMSTEFEINKSLDIVKTKGIDDIRIKITDEKGNVTIGNPMEPMNLPPSQKPGNQVITEKIKIQKTPNGKYKLIFPEKYQMDSQYKYSIVAKVKANEKAFNEFSKKPIINSFVNVKTSSYGGLEDEYTSNKIEHSKLNDAGLNKSAIKLRKTEIIKETNGLIPNLRKKLLNKLGFKISVKNQNLSKELAPKIQESSFQKQGTKYIYSPFELFNLPKDTVIKVQEKDTDVSGYKLDVKQKSNGNITNKLETKALINANSSLEIENNYTIDQSKIGTVTVENHLTGNAIEDKKTYEYIIYLRDKNNVPYNDTEFLELINNQDIDEMLKHYDKTNGRLRFILKDGEKFELKLSNKTKYSVLQKEYTSDGYQTTASITNDDQVDNVDLKNINVDNKSYLQMPKLYAVNVDKAKKNNLVIFENTRNLDPPTGLQEHNQVQLLIFIFGIGLITLLACKRRQTHKDS